MEPAVAPRWVDSNIGSIKTEINKDCLRCCAIYPLCLLHFEPCFKHVSSLLSLVFCHGAHVNRTEYGGAPTSLGVLTDLRDDFERIRSGRIGRLQKIKYLLALLWKKLFERAGVHLFLREWTIM